MNSKREVVSASAPGKLMLTGSYAVVHGQGSIVTAVDQRLKVSVAKNGVDIFHLDAPDLGLHAYSKTISDLGKKQLPKGVRFIEHLYKRFLEEYPQDHGIIVTTKSDFSASFGFGSSSAVTVAFAKALTTLYEIELSRRELFDLCYTAVIDVQGVGSGFDIAAAIWGGTLYYERPASKVESVNAQNLSLVVGYTGIKADTPTLIHMVNTRLKKKEDYIKSVFSQIGKSSLDLKASLESGDIRKAGKVISFHQKQVRKLGVSSSELEDLIAAAENAGAYGATLSGAGGGDCMVALVDDSSADHVRRAIERSGGEVIDVVINALGVRIE